MKEFKLTTIDGLILSVNLFDEVSEAKGVVQLIHGNAENISWYEDFAKRLNKSGYIVIGIEQRGHGQSAFDNDLPLGYFATFDGWKKLVDDQLLLNSYIKKNWMDLPVFMFGHSMGGLIAMDYAIKYSKTIDGLIVSGTTSINSAKLLGEMVLSTIMEITGPKRQGRLLWNWVFKNYNKKWADRPSTTGYEWRSQNPKVIKEITSDPRIGQPLTTSGFKDIFRGMWFVQQKSHLKLIDKNLPILLIAGKADPMGDYGQGPTEVYNKLKELGYNVELKLYPGQRHEIMFEPKKKIAESDLIKFMDKNVK